MDRRRALLYLGILSWSWLFEANPAIAAEKQTFDTPFRTIYKDIIECRPGTLISSIESTHLKVNGTQGKVVSIIVPHGAPALLQNAGLTNGGERAPVHPLRYESMAAGSKGKGIRVIGDSCTAPVQPTAAQLANSQAKVCAGATARYFQNLDPLADPGRNASITTNSAGCSPMTYGEAYWLSANYGCDKAMARMKLAHLGEARGIS